MIHMNKIHFVDSDFTVENTIKENLALQQSNRTLNIILRSFLIISIGVSTYIIIKSNIEESTQRWV